MTDILDGVRDHYRATGLTERLKTALMAFVSSLYCATIGTVTTNGPGTSVDELHPGLSSLATWSR